MGEVENCLINRTRAEVIPTLVSCTVHDQIGGWLTNRVSLEYLWKSNAGLI